MANPYVGEIRIFAGTFAPVGWEFCQGQSLPIAENDTLFNLIGTTYGGDGVTTFNLPDLRSRVPIHQGTGGIGTATLGQSGGVETVTLTTAQIPAHAHGLSGSSASATTSAPAGGVPATLAAATTFAYGTDAPPTTLSNLSLVPAGGNQSHGNVQPYLVINFIISLFGIYPSPS